MNESEIHETYLRFASPLVPFAQLGAGVEATDTLARNLWIAMICGGKAEQQMWDQLRESDSQLFDLLKRCYDEEMRPAVGDATLEQLRDWYRRQEENNTSA